jgi:hypothetical protein
MSRRQRKLRVLVGSHGHPAIHPGGAEIAAYSLFQALQARPDTEAWFLGCDRGRLPPRAGPCITQPFATDREFIYAGGAFDWFRFANHHTEFAPAFAALLMELRPDVLHLHHYINFGVEVFSIARRALPDLRIFLTLHEYLAICHHFGQMVKHPSRALCYRESPAECHACFPDSPPADFFLRKTYIQRFFNDVDGFIAPSKFLADRYLAWGLPPDRLRIIPNVPAPHTPATPAPRPEGAPLHVGYFGQISPLKGIQVFRPAAANPPQHGVRHPRHRRRPTPRIPSRIPRKTRFRRPQCALPWAVCAGAGGCADANRGCGGGAEHMVGKRTNGDAGSGAERTGGGMFGYRGDGGDGGGDRGCGVSGGECGGFGDFVGQRRPNAASAMRVQSMG